MATKTKPRPVAKASTSAAKTASASIRTHGGHPKPGAPVPITSATELPRTPPATPDEFILHIKVLGKRLDEHVAFMCGAEKLVGTSAEARQRSLSQFYGRIVAFETELGRIRDELQLG